MSDLSTELQVIHLSDCKKVFEIMKQYNCKTCYICSNDFAAENIIMQNRAAVVINPESIDFLNALDAEKPTCMFVIAFSKPRGDLETFNEWYYMLKDKGYLSTMLYLQDKAPEDLNTVELTSELNKAENEIAKLSGKYLHAISNESYFTTFCNNAANGTMRAKHYATGMVELDKLLNGGLTSGLYVLLAAPATGKTTLCLQWADNIAASGQNVLYVSAEMSRAELMARSLSRQSYKQAPGLAVSEQEIFDGDFSAQVERLKNVSSAYANLLETEKHIFISEHDGAPTVDGIRHEMETIKMLSGQLPIVFIDYLQLMLPIDADARRATDTIVMQLKQLSRQFETPIVVISAVNRGSYSADNLKSAGKESGGIEYSADCIINYDLRAKLSSNGKQQKFAMQGKNISGFTDRAEFNAMKTPTRKMVLTVSKNRRGGLGETWLEYTSKYNTVKEIPIDNGEE